MYSRSARKLELSKSETGPNLGPGCYNKDVFDPCEEKEPAYAPFSTLAPRTSAFDEMITEGPAPGTYDAFFSRSKSCKTSTFGKSKCRRFELQVPVSPGPGVYGTEISRPLRATAPPLTTGGNVRILASTDRPGTDMILVSTSVKSEPSDAKPGQEAAADGETALPHSSVIDDTYVGAYQPTVGGTRTAPAEYKRRPRIVWKRKSMPPSIPVGDTAYGYAETDDGELKARKPPKVDQTRGPAFYNPKVGFAEEGRAMKRGPKFSPSEVERLTFKKTDTPGPASYELVSLDQAFSVRVSPESRAAASKDSRRFGELVIAEEKKKSVPGPGAYSVRSDFEQKIAKKRGPSFGASKADRFAGRSSSFPGQGRDGCLGTAVETPGPGAYSPSLQDGNRKLPGKFSPSRSHAEVEVNNSISPGPAAYNPDDTLVRRGGHASRRGRDSGKAFGSLTDRFRTYKVKQEPGPGTYEVSEPLGSPSASGKQGAARVGRKLWSTKKTYGQLHRTGLSGLSTELAELAKQRYGTQTIPVFGSGMKRFESAPNSDVPPPGAYNTMSAFKNVVAHGCSSVSQRYQSPVSRTPRVLFSITADIPGPGKYEPKVPEQHTSLRRDDGTFLTRTTRFRREPGEPGKAEPFVPGPGTYLGPQYDHSLFKRTFNVTYAQPTQVV